MARLRAWLKKLMIKLIVGLGNPGLQYEKTRHNAGFLFLDYLMNSRGAGWLANGQFHGEVGSLKIGAAKVELLKPMTFMNKSGLSVGKFIRYYKFKPEDVLVVHDELELAECVVRLKQDGGHAGHNGLRDIIAHINSRNFLRLRIGIGRPVAGGVADYVLSKPGNEMFSGLQKVFSDIERELDLLVAGEVEQFNKVFNG
jgi:PTH1 family peptidyl-tRNA hydrolase